MQPIWFLSPEHPLIDKYKNIITNYDEVLLYREMASKKSDFERTELSKEKTGVPLKGINAINPVNGKSIPVWISDYVLMSYGTGAIMAVPAHDERDWEFAKKFNLPIIEVVKGGNVDEAAFTDTETGVLVNSDFLNNMEVKDAKEKIIVWLEEKGIGKRKINYKLRDWVFSRQRYWENLFHLYIVKNVVGFQFLRISFLLLCQRLKTMYQQKLVNHLLLILENGLKLLVQNVVVMLKEKQILCLNGLVPLGIS